MGDSAYKDYPMNIRMPGGMRDEIERTAESLHLSPAALARALMEEFVRARNAHGAEVAWPPVFMRRTGAMIAANATDEPAQKAPLTYARAERIPALVADRPGTSHAKARG